MKKLIVLSLCAVCAAWVHAENMQFVTLLSQPVGTFAKVDLLDPGQEANIYHLNFCQNTLDGTIEANTMSVKNLEMGSNKLKGNVPSYTTKGMSLGRNGDLKGGHLEVKEFLTNSNSISGFDANSHYVNVVAEGAVSITGDVTSDVASFSKMNITGVDKKGWAKLETPSNLINGTRAQTGSMGWNKHSGCIGEGCGKGNATSSAVLLNGTPTRIFANQGITISNPGVYVDGVLSQEYLDRMNTSVFKK